ncbi:MAG: VTT domain-containing protein [Candidatus Paceibacterota bacterium]
MSRYISKGELVVIAVVAILFIVSAYLSQAYQPQIKMLITSYNGWGMVAYVLFATFETVIAPVSTLPILPVAVASWGSFTAALLSITAWTLGSIIAFLLARRYGRPIIERFFDIRKVEALGAGLLTHNVFWTVLFARMVIPVDLLSYAVGLFVPMRTSLFALATLIGITPFAFVFAYTSSLSLVYIILIGVVSLVIMFFGYKYFTRGDTPPRSY